MPYIKSKVNINNRGRLEVSPEILKTGGVKKEIIAAKKLKLILNKSNKKGLK